MSAPANCGTCLFWLHAPEQGDTTGLCRRYPPYVIQVGPPTQMPNGIGIPTQGLFPPMDMVGWCGEYAPCATPRHLQQ